MSKLASVSGINNVYIVDLGRIVWLPMGKSLGVPVALGLLVEDLIGVDTQ